MILTANQPIVKNAAAGFQIKKQSGSAKMYTLTLSSDNRTDMRNEVSKRLAAAKMVYQQVRIPGSGFDGISFTNAGQLIRFLFKETAGSAIGEMTKYAESAQCIYCAAAQLKRGAITTEFVLDNKQRIMSMFDTDAKFDEVFDRMDATWKKSSMLIANSLQAKYSFSGFVFHRNSPLVQRIYSRFSQLNKVDGKRLFSQADKWNPADIWAIKSGFVPDLGNLKSLEEMNNWLIEMINARKIIPISLKKVTRDPHIKPVNIEAEASHAPTGVHYTGMAISTGRTDWTSSKNVRINMTNGTSDMYIELRQSKGGAAINGEINMKRSVARHGKLHHEHAINKTLRAFGTPVHFMAKNERDRMSRELDPWLVQQVFDLAKEIDPSNPVRFDDFTKFLREKASTDPDWLASKYEGLQILHAFNKLSKENKQHACEMLFTLGSAASDLAGPFIKVYH